jgi:hypothetical protein
MVKTRKRQKSSGDTVLLGLNINGVLTSLFGGVITLLSGVGVYLITSTLKQGHENNNLLISHSMEIREINHDLKDVKQEQQRVKDELSKKFSINDN